MVHYRRYIIRLFKVILFIVTLAHLNCISANESTDILYDAVAIPTTSTVTTSVEITTATVANLLAISVQIADRTIMEELGDVAISPPSDSALVSSSTDKVSVPALEVQKCCPLGQVLKLGPPGSKALCEEDDAIFDAPICHSNSTHYWKINYTMKEINFVHRDPCTLKFFYEVDEVFCLLSNSSLYSSTNYEMLNKDQYCMETILFDSGMKHTTGCVCIIPSEKEMYPFVYGAGQIISTIFLTILAAFSVRRNDISKSRKMCVCCFSSTMAFAFFIMALHNFLLEYVQAAITIITGYIVHYFIVSYFVWLNILYFDTFCRTKCVDEISPYRTRYLLIGFLSPLPFILVSFFAGFRPALPDLYVKSQFASGLIWCLCLFHLPILIPLVINNILLARKPDTNTNLKRFFESLRASRRREQEIKNRKRRTCFLCILMYIFMLMDLTIYLLPSSAEIQTHFIIRDAAGSLQGVFVTLVFFQKKLFQKNITDQENNDLEMEYSRNFNNVQSLSEQRQVLQNGDTT